MPQFSDDLFLGNAPTYMGVSKDAITSTFTASAAGTTLTVTALLSGDVITLGMYVNTADGTSIPNGTFISAFGSGTGGVGTYTLSASATATSRTVTGTGNAFLDNPSPMSLGVGPLGRVYIFDVNPQSSSIGNIANAQTFAAGASVPLAAGINTKLVTRNNGQTAIQLDCPRGVSVTNGGASNASAITFSGYDYYGQPMTEVVTASATPAATVNGKKAFYQITSIIVGAATGTAIDIGTSDVVGLPIRVTDAGYVIHNGYNNAIAPAAGTFVAADQATATSTTGDVRGTYAADPGTPFNGNRRLVMSIAVPAIAAGPNATRTGALGVTQA
jgi:hypothetical protein